MTQPYDPDSIDLTNCDREPIHIPGRVQPFGYLVSVSNDWIVNHVSANVEDLFGRKPEDMIGEPLNGLLSGETIHEIRSRLTIVAHADSVERAFRLNVTGDGRLFDVAVHTSGRSIVMEFEPSDSTIRKDYVSSIRTMMTRLQNADSTERLAEMAARFIKAMSGFDRVMVYRFDEDGAGEVIAEERRPDLESFLGLHYPASDIPRQARELYRRNLLRIISDVNGKTLDVVPPANMDGEPLDLSLSTLRAVSPIHLEYLRNMGVQASLSVSILKRGELWGLFACHHYDPMVLPFDLRTALELFGEWFAFIIDQRESDEARKHSQRAQSLHDRIMSQIADGTSITDQFQRIADALRSVIDCDGVIAYVDGQFQSVGRTPTEEEFRPLVRLLNTNAQNDVYTTDNLTAAYPKASAIADRAAGIMAIPVSRTPRDYLVLFRGEVARTVNWAGDPSKPVEVGPHGARLTPRKSFELWQEVVRERSKPWTNGEIAAAEALRITLLEVVLRIAEAANQDRARAQERQELLIAELNHRVRNILNLIRGLVSQSASEARTATDLTQLISGRVHALARAHDQITRTNWDSASMRSLIETEVKAYLGDRAGRVSIDGPDVYLRPTAYTVLALVVHELVTNSAKYGALSDSSGRISIELSALTDHGLGIAWRERGGPPVKAPSRRGFGTTITEQSVPFELNGEANVRFELTGLEADYRIPPRQVDRFEESSAVDDKAAPRAGTSGGGTFGGCALLVEDNLIIALDAEQILRDLGADDVLRASTVSRSMELLDDNDVDFALLDVSLDSETSHPIAERLRDAGIPFIFATGYGEHKALTDSFPDVPVVQKPYDNTTISQALAEAGIGEDEG